MRAAPARRLVPLLGLAVALLSASPAGAYRRLKWGPFELLPSLTLELRQHSNVYVSSEDAPETVTKDVSGLILDLRPGLILSAKPNLEKRIKGLYVDARYVPSLVFFPNAPELVIGDGDTGRDSGTPDIFKLDHNLRAGVRWQTSGRFALFTNLDYTNPELALTDVSLEDLTTAAGAKLDFTRSMSIEGSVGWKRFETPEEFTVVRDRTAETDVRPSEFGTFDQLTYGSRLAWAWRPSLTLDVAWSRSDREFAGSPFVPSDGSPGQALDNNFNRDDVPDNRKDYVEQTVSASARKRLTRQVRGTFTFGRTWRETDARQFGSREYSTWIGSATFDAVVAKRTRLQFSAERMLTDTIRELTILDVNAFTADQTGQFTVIPEQFAAVYDERYMVDLIQNVFRRGDQILLGFAYQKDRLVDQIGTGNFFIPGTPFRRDLAGECEEVDADGSPLFCRPVLSEERQRLWLVTAGYRYRFSGRLRFLGLQLRGAYFKGVSRAEPTDALRELVDAGLAPDPGEPEDIDTTYWSFGGGLVINLQVFQ